jgi:hypothetical protein
MWRQDLRRGFNMSKVLATKSYLFNSAMGDVLIESQLLVEFDVEDTCRNRAVSQARLVQFSNIGEDIDRNAVLPKDAIPSAFIKTEE